MDNNQLMRELLVKVTAIDERLEHVMARQNEMSEQMSEFMPLANGHGLHDGLAALVGRVQGLEVRAALLEATGKMQSTTVGRWVDFGFRLAGAIFAAWMVYRLGLR